MVTTTDRDAVERLAPERIIASSDHKWTDSIWSNPCGSEYILKSHADAQLQAAVAEFREAAAEKCERAAKSEVGRERAYLLSHAAWFRSSFPTPTDALERAIEAEREACAVEADETAQEADQFSDKHGRQVAERIATIIRARSDAQTGV